MQDNIANDKPETGERERKNGIKRKENFSITKNKEE
jgi:hypothetical protein